MHTRRGGSAEAGPPSCSGRCGCDSCMFLGRWRTFAPTDCRLFSNAVGDCCHFDPRRDHRSLRRPVTDCRFSFADSAAARRDAGAGPIACLPVVSALDQRSSELVRQVSVQGRRHHPQPSGLGALHGLHRRPPVRARASSGPVRDHWERRRRTERLGRCHCLRRSSLPFRLTDLLVQRSADLLIDVPSGGTKPVNRVVACPRTVNAPAAGTT